MTSADFSQFVITARLLFFSKPRLRDLPSYGRTLSGLYPLGLLSAVRIVIGLLLLVQHHPCLPAFYQVLIHRANRLPPASFRFRLTVDTLAFGCNLPTIRAVWGLAPVRVRSCWANTKNGLQIVWGPFYFPAASARNRPSSALQMSRRQLETVGVSEGNGSGYILLVYVRRNTLSGVFCNSVMAYIALLNQQAQGQGVMTVESPAHMRFSEEPGILA